MKRVPFKTAEVIKEAGYPQDQSWNFETLVITDCNHITPFLNVNSEKCYSCPTYLDVWLWLWREKGIKIDLDYYTQSCTIYINDDGKEGFSFADPEEAIITAIEYLVTNNLIK